MPDNFVANPGAGGDTFAADDVAGVKYPYSKIDIGDDGAASPVTTSNPLPVEISDGTNTAVIRPLSTPPVSSDNALMTQAVIHGRSTAGGGAFVDVKVNPSGTLSADVSGSTGVGVTGPLTDAQLRASPVPVSGTVSTGGLTDAQLRAANVATSLNATIFRFSTNNTSSAELAPGATFAGVIETALDQPSISLLLTSDQPITLTVYQYIDAGGAYAVPPITYYVQANKGFSASFGLNGNYVRVAATNTGTATTTAFELNTAYGTLPTSDGTGNLPTTHVGAADYSGVPLIEACITGDLALHTKTSNPELRDINGARIPSDSPAVVRIVASTVGQQFLIDTRGYQSLGLTMITMAATITGSNDTSGGFLSVPGIIVSGGSITSTAAVGSSYSIPCLTRYIKVTVSTIGTAYYTLRQILTPHSLSLFPSNVNINQYNGVTPSSTNPVHMTPVALAATNNQTIPAINVVTSVTPAATVVKATAGRLTMLTISNGAAAAAYLHLYNAASVTLGTTASAMVFAIPAAVANYPIKLPDGGLYFSTGICYAFTGAIASTDNTVLVTPSLVANLTFI